MDKEDLLKQLQHLKQENEKLQNIKDETYFKLKEEYKEQNAKYAQCLEEVRNIAQNYNSYDCKYCTQLNCEKCCEGHLFEFNVEQILDKINEVLDEH